MYDFLLIAILCLIAAVVGLRFMKSMGTEFETASDHLALAVSMGMACLAVLALFLGIIGELRPEALAAGLVGLALMSGAAAWRHLGRLTKELIRGSLPQGFTPRVLAGCLGLAVLGTFFTSLTPVTDGDALCYHLQVPKQFLVQQGLYFDPDLHETVYPLLTEMLYAIALAFRGPIACRLVHWVLGILFAANVTALARKSLGPRAWWAGAIALLVPAVSNGMGAPLNDVALATFGTASLVALERYWDQRESRWLTLTGGMAGLAIGVKYPALVLVGLIGLSIVWRELNSSWNEDRLREDRWSMGGRAMKHLLHFSLLVLGVGGVWYLRAWYYTGNPVYPFFRAWFGGAGLDEVLDPIKRPMPVTVWNLVTALGPLTLQPDRFDSFSHQFGPAFLLFLPALLIERSPRRVRAIVGVGFAFLLLCLTQRQSMRFVLIAVGPMSIGVAWLLSQWTERSTFPSRAIVSVLLIMACFETGLAVARGRHGLKVALGIESETQFLSRGEPTFVVGRWVSDNLHKASRIVGQDHRGFYFPCDYHMELAHRRRTGLGTRGESSTAVARELRSRGFTHVLFCPPVPENAVEFDGTLGRLLADWRSARQPLFREDLSDADGVVRQYAIYALDEQTASRHLEPERP